MTESAITKILLVSGVAQPRGTSAYTLGLLRELTLRSYECVLATVEGPMVAEYEKLSAQVHVLPKLDKPRSPFFPKQQLISLATEAQPHIVHAQSQHAVAAAFHGAEALGVPCVLTIHMPLSKRGLKRAIASVNGIIAVSQAVREDLVNKVKIPKDMIQVIPNGLDVAQYNNAQPRREGSVPIIATAGPLEPQKAQKDFLAAAKLILDARHNVQLLVIGDGPEESRLRQQATDLGIQKNVTFVTNLTDYRQAIGTCDIFVLPSLQEGLGLSVLQAMAFGKPVVSSNAGGLCVLVRDGENGLMVKKSDPQGIAEAVGRLIEDPGLAATLGSCARRFVEAEFSIAACVDKTLAFFEEALSPTPP